MRTLWNITQYIFWFGVFLFIIVSGLAGIPVDQPSPLPIRGLVVRSGSMEPTIMTGDVIIAQTPQPPAINQIITFIDAEKRVITHRIIDTDPNDSSSFITKGDNNNTEDPTSISADHIIGTYWFRVPLAGYLLQATRQGTGLVLLFSVPLLMIIASELFKEKKHAAVSSSDTRTS